MDNGRHSEDEEQPPASIHEQQGSDQLLQGDLDPGNEGTSIVFPLEDDDLQAGLLKSYKNVSEEDQDKPRAIITAKDLPRLCYFHVRFSTAHYGSFRAQPEEPLKWACRIVLDFSFQQLSSWRFESAEIELEFEDAANVVLHGVKRSEDAIVDTTHQPRVLAFEPQYFSGPVSFAEGTRNDSLQVNVSPPGGIAGLSGGVSATKPYHMKECFKMHGVLRDNPPSRIVWTMAENKLTKEGIRREVSTALIVSYTPGHKFAARVRVRANLWMGFLRPVCGKKDEPIFFNPDKMRLKGQVRSFSKPAGQQAEGVKTVPGVEDEVFDRASLRALTRLSSFGGEFL
jgi:hypothetical protein